MRRVFGIAGGLALLILATATTTAPAKAAGAPAASRPLVNQRCPVTTDEFSTPSHELQFQGVAVRFCCDKCAQRFLLDPANYVSALPQFTPEMIERTVAAAHGHALASMPEPWIARWLGPIALAVAGAVVAWLVARIVRRGPMSTRRTRT
jgi:hypothetical protein